MRKMMRLLLVTGVASVASAALLSGCGGDGGGVDDGPDYPIRVALCERLFRCSDNVFTAARRGGFLTVERCTEYLPELDVTTQVRPFIEVGTVLVDEAGIERCVAALGASCSVTQDALAACNRGLFAPQIPVDGPCTSGLECVSGVCSAEPNTCGMCVATLTPGTTCCVGASCPRCGPGPGGEPGFCASDSTGVCEFVEDPERITDLALGEECFVDDEQGCAAGLYCDGEVCAAWLEVGEVCDPELDSCAVGHYCVASEDDDSVGTCVALRLESSAGNVCGRVADDEIVSCDSLTDFLVCSGDTTTEGICFPVALLQDEGERCEVTSQCVRGTQCLENRCVGEPRATGEACVVNAQCENYHCVLDGETGTCEPFACAE